MLPDYLRPSTGKNSKLLRGQSRLTLCVPTDAVSCAGAGECERVTAKELDIPQHIKVDLGKKALTGTFESGDERKVPYSQCE